MKKFVYILFFFIFSSCATITNLKDKRLPAEFSLHIANTKQQLDTAIKWSTISEQGQFFYFYKITERAGVEGKIVLITKANGKENNIQSLSLRAINLEIYCKHDPEHHCKLTDIQCKRDFESLNQCTGWHFK